MMKKILLTGMAIIITAVICIGIIDTLNEPMSDKEIMDDYIKERYGEQYYGVLYGDDGDEYIEFVVFENGHDQYSVSIDRRFYK